MGGSPKVLFFAIHGRVAHSASAVLMGTTARLAESRFGE